MKDYIFFRCKLSSWNRVRRAVYKSNNETFSEYLERLSKIIEAGK